MGWCIFLQKTTVTALKRFICLSVNNIFSIPIAITFFGFTAWTPRQCSNDLIWFAHILNPYNGFWKIIGLIFVIMKHSNNCEKNSLLPFLSPLVVLFIFTLVCVSARIGPPKWTCLPAAFIFQTQFHKIDCSRSIKDTQKIYYVNIFYSKLMNE